MTEWIGRWLVRMRSVCLKREDRKLKRFLSILPCAILFALGGCGLKGNQGGDIRFHDDGRAKPIVAFVPVFDQSGSDIGWSLSEELTDLLKNRLFKRARFYVTVPSSHDKAWLGVSEETHPFSSEVQWIQEAFDSYEYVVFIELVEYNIHSKEKKQTLLDKVTPSYELSMTARARIFDLRGEKLEVILQEFIHKNYSIPKPNALDIANPNRWKKWTHHVSPLGLSHAQFCKEVVKRVEEYIALSKSQ